MAQSFEAWWASLGPVTKFVLIVSVLCTCAFSFGVVHPSYLIVNFEDLIWKFQIWRPITSSLFLGKFGFPWLIAVAMLVMWTDRNERDENHAGRRADLIWMMTVIIIALHVCAFFLQMMLLSFAFAMSLAWIWCKRHENAQLSIYMFTFNAPIFPWALLLFHLCLGQSIVDDLVGIVCGHFYFFLRDIFPKTHGVELVKTPQFLINWFPPERLAPQGVYVTAPGGRPIPGAADPPRHPWGTGRQLGT